VIIINRGMRKKSLKSILKELNKSNYGVYIGDINRSKHFLLKSISYSKVGAKEFVRYLEFLSKTPAHLVMFYRMHGLFIFRFEDDMARLSPHSFIFLMKWFVNNFNNEIKTKKLDVLYKEIHSSIER